MNTTPDPRLVAKYDVAGPRYTSYPTVPFWDEEHFSVPGWLETVRAASRQAGEGLGIYVHLPFCESLCTFCGCTKRITRRHDVERPYVEALLAEWQMYRRELDAPPRLAELHLGGGTPTFFSPDNLAALLEPLLAAAPPAPGHELGFEAHPNNTTGEHLTTLHALGFRRLSLGVQDFDPVVQKCINRIQPPDQVRRVTDQARAIGYESVGFDLVYGLPKQRPESVASTVDEVVRMRPDRIAYYGYAHVPWIRGIGQRGFDDADVPRGADKLALYEIGRRKLLDAGYRELGMDHFSLESDGLWRAVEEGRLHRNFMGYTVIRSSLILGLGMSAIGDSWSGFAQNDKTVEGYTERVGRGELPVVRGHLLDQEDQLIRRHVLDLMCRFETRWDPGRPPHPAIADALERLRELEADGLVEIDDAAVRVLPAGRPFLRNVCMAFDARLWRGGTTERMFSQVI
jgi:oxygen-independent coproporphyrinogen-3 oxidase